MNPSGKAAESGLLLLRQSMPFRSLESGLTMNLIAGRRADYRIPAGAFFAPSRFKFLDFGIHRSWTNLFVTGQGEEYKNWQPFSCAQG
jgi:hypothetical protein